MGTVAVITSQVSDEEWIFRALDGALVFVDQSHLADVCVISADTVAMVVDHLPPTIAVVVIGDPATPHARAAHVITREWRDFDVRVLLTALAVGHPAPELPLPPPQNPNEARDAQRAIAATRKLTAAADLLQCESTVVEILIELLEVDRAYCLYYDHESLSIWSEAKLQGPAGDERRAIAGLAGFAAVTGRVAVAEAAGRDPRFVGLIDDPDGDAGDRMIAQPVYGADGFVHGVMVATRRARRPPFGPQEQVLLARFAKLVSPILDQLQIQVAAQAILEDAAGDGGLFRREAAEAQAMPRWGDVVRVAPGWLSWAYWLLVILLAGSVAFVVIGKVSTYSEGMAVIRSSARTVTTARVGGIVSTVEVRQGDPVSPGMVLARFDDTDQRLAVARLEREFETQLRRHMLDPGDTGADSALRTVRNELDASRTAMEDRLIRASAAGSIGEVYLRPGQRIEPGGIVASIVDNSKGLQVIAVLPGEDRPQLAEGMDLRLELVGYRYAYQTVRIERLSPDVLAPNEARSMVGPEVADSLRITAPVIIAYGQLPSTAFEVDGRQYRYHDGMLGIAQVRVRSEPIVFALIPGARRLGE